MSETPNDFRNIVAFRGEPEISRALLRAADALGQARAEYKNVVAKNQMQRERLDFTANRISELEAALQEIAHGKANGMKNGGIMCRVIAKQALGPAGGTRDPEDFNLWCSECQLPKMHEDCDHYPATVEASDDV